MDWQSPGRCRTKAAMPVIVAAYLFSCPPQVMPAWELLIAPAHGTRLAGDLPPFCTGEIGAGEDDL